MPSSAADGRIRPTLWPSNGSEPSPSGTAAAMGLG